MLVRRNEDRAGPGIAQKFGGLLGRERGVNRDHHGPEQHAGKVRNHPLVAVFAENCDSISARYTPRAKRAQYSTDLGCELFGGNRLPAGLGLAEQEMWLVPAGNVKEDVVEGLEAHPRNC